MHAEDVEHALIELESALDTARKMGVVEQATLQVLFNLSKFYSPDLRLQTRVENMLQQWLKDIRTADVLTAILFEMPNNANPRRIRVYRDREKAAGIDRDKAAMEIIQQAWLSIKNDGLKAAWGIGREPLRAPSLSDQVARTAFGLRFPHRRRTYVARANMIDHDALRAYAVEKMEAEPRYTEYREKFRALHGRDPEIKTFAVFGSYIYGFVMAPSDLDVWVIVEGDFGRHLELSLMALKLTDVPPEVFKNKDRVVTRMDLKVVGQDLMVESPNRAASLKQSALILGKTGQYEDYIVQDIPLQNILVVVHNLIDDAEKYARGELEPDPGVLPQSKSLRRLSNALTWMARILPRVPDVVDKARETLTKVRALERERERKGSIDETRLEAPMAELTRLNQEAIELAKKEFSKAKYVVIRDRLAELFESRKPASILYPLIKNPVFTIVGASLWETFAYPFVGAQSGTVLGLAWATLGFAFSHTIVEWLARSRNEHWKSDFIKRLILSIGFLQFYFYLSPATATLSAFVTHATYNAVMLLVRRKDKDISALEVLIDDKKKEFDAMSQFDSGMRLDRARAFERFDRLLRGLEYLKDYWPTYFHRYVANVLTPLLKNDVRTLNFLLGSHASIRIFRIGNSATSIGRELDESTDWENRLRKAEEGIREIDDVADYYYLPGLPIIVEATQNTMRRRLGRLNEAARILVGLFGIDSSGVVPDELKRIESIVITEDSSLGYHGRTYWEGHINLQLKSVDSLKIADALIHEGTHWALSESEVFEPIVTHLFNGGKEYVFPNWFSRDGNEGNIGNIMDEAYAYAQGMRVYLNAWDRYGFNPVKHGYNVYEILSVLEDAADAFRVLEQADAEGEIPDIARPFYEHLKADWADIYHRIDPYARIFNSRDSWARLTLLEIIRLTRREWNEQYGAYLALAPQFPLMTYERLELQVPVIDEKPRLTSLRRVMVLMGQSVHGWPVADVLLPFVEPIEPEPLRPEDTDPTKKIGPDLVQPAQTSSVRDTRIRSDELGRRGGAIIEEIHMLFSPVMSARTYARWAFLIENSVVVVFPALIMSGLIHVFLWDASVFRASFVTMSTIMWGVFFIFHGHANNVRRIPAGIVALSGIIAAFSPSGLMMIGAPLLVHFLVNRLVEKMESNVSIGKKNAGLESECMNTLLSAPFDIDLFKKYVNGVLAHGLYDYPAPEEYEFIPESAQRRVMSEREAENVLVKVLERLDQTLEAQLMLKVQGVENRQLEINDMPVLTPLSMIVGEDYYHFIADRRSGTSEIHMTHYAENAVNADFTQLYDTKMLALDKDTLVGGNRTWKFSLDPKRFVDPNAYRVTMKSRSPVPNMLFLNKARLRYMQLERIQPEHYELMGRDEASMLATEMAALTTTNRAYYWRKIGF
jgi:predicted nucleotidyltransferase